MRAFLMISAGLAASTALMSDAAADWKGYSGLVCRPGTASVTYELDGMKVNSNGYVVCPVIRDNSTATLSYLKINLHRSSWQTTICWLHNLQARSDTAYTTDRGTSATGFVELTFTLPDYDYGTWVVECAAKAGDKIRNIRWSE